MAKVKIVKSLLVLVLLPGLLVGCQGLPTESSNNNRVSVTPSSEETPTDDRSPALTDSTSSNPDVKKFSEQVASLEKQNKNLENQVTELTRQVSELQQKLIAPSIMLGIGLSVVIGLWVNKRWRIYQYNLRRTSHQSLLTGSTKLPNTKSAPIYSVDDFNILEARINKLETELNKFYDQSARIKTPLQNIESDLKSSYQTNSPYNSVTPNQQSAQPRHETGINHGNNVSSLPGQIHPVVSYASWVDTYNKNPDLLLKNAILVSETEESIEQRRLGYKQPPIMEQHKHGNYWILTSGGDNYLVPKGNMRINEYSYKTVESLFQCDGYTAGYSSNFILIKPAKVFPSGKQWELIELGVIQFI